MQNFILNFNCTLSFFLCENVHAQSEITFNVNFKPELEDSVFISGKNQL